MRTTKSFRSTLLLLPFFAIFILAGCKKAPEEPQLFHVQPSRNYGEPVWGPNNIILFNHTPEDSGSSGLWQIKPDGTEKRFFLDPSFYTPDWSHDGRWLALSRDAQIYKVTFEKDSVVQLTGGSLRKFHPSWSPDGRWITYSINDGDYKDWGIWAVSVDGTERRQLIRITGVNPDWSPDGTKICFLGWPGTTRKQKLLLMDADGKNLRTVFDPVKYGNNDSWSLNHPSFSPDGSQIVFQMNSTDKQDPQIWVVSSDGTNPMKLAANGAREPSWSPDGRFIVYALHSARNPQQPGNGKLWMMDAGGRIRWQFTF